MRRLAFTILELLVVIAIIAILMAILIPTVNYSRKQAKTVACASNVRELVIGLHAYEAENQIFPQGFDGDHPGTPPQGYSGLGEFDKMGWWWFNFLPDYFRKDSKHREVLWCPDRQLTGSRLKKDVLCGNYGVNQSICKDSYGTRKLAEFVGSPLRLGDIPKPSSTLLVVDSGYALINWWHVTTEPPGTFSTRIEDTAYIPGLPINLEINKKRTFWPEQQKDAIGDRHPSKTVNIGFADSHVAKTKATELIVEKNGESYKNHQPLWRPK